MNAVEQSELVQDLHTAGHRCHDLAEMAKSDKLTGALAFELVGLVTEALSRLPIPFPKGDLPNASDVLRAAATATTGREKEYGPAHEHFNSVAVFWSLILGRDVWPEHVPLCMMAVKLSRLAHDPSHFDSLVDIAGYASIAVESSQRSTR